MCIRDKIAGVARQNELLFAQRIAGGVQSGQQALGGGFLVAGGAVELARAVQSRCV